ncbi:carbohydrate ABC transporter permease [Microlunatus sp. GCM10028923]|uniref:carbohydrate ABC transporter permease n=1 Tax=Microlunatus sp. GCM10028923 TaxID=3273400 RepID=UPI003609C253
MITTATPPESVGTDVDRGPRRIRRHRPRTVIRLTVISAILFPLCLLWIYPFIWMVSASVKSNKEIFAGLNPFPEIVRLDNYVRAWEQANIGRYFFNSVFITVFSIIISVTATALIGYVLGRYRFPGKKVIIGLFAAAVFLPEGYTIIPIFDLISNLGLSGSLWGVTLAEAGGAHVVATLLFAGYFRQLPGELEEAARIDGAGFFRIFGSIYLPLAKPVIATAVILQFMHSWNSFLLPLVLTLSRPELRTLAVGVYSFRGEYLNDWSGMAAASTISLIPIIVVFLILQRYFVESIAGAVKN